MKSRWLVAAAALLSGLAFVRLNESQVESAEPATPRTARNTAPRPVIFHGENVVPYVFHLDDVYVRRGQAWRLNTDAELTRGAGQTLFWRGGRALVQVARRADFTGRRQFLRGDGGRVAFTTAFVGANFWRVSFDGGNSWSGEKAFTVAPRFTDRPLELALRAKRTLGVRGAPAGEQILVELAPTRAFAPAETRVVPWSADLTVAAFARARAVNARSELGAYSNVVGRSSTSP